MVTAFKTGKYGKTTYSGEYGDLGAAVAAVVTHKEATSHTLDREPTSGRLREPLLKVLHVMRSMEYQAVGGREVELHDLSNKIGQMYTESPSVFSFFLPEYQPDGLIAEADSVAPEAISLNLSLTRSMARGPHAH